MRPLLHFSLFAILFTAGVANAQTVRDDDRLLTAGWKLPVMDDRLLEAIRWGMPNFDIAATGAAKSGFNSQGTYIPSPSFAIEPRGLVDSRLPRLAIGAPAFVASPAASSVLERPREAATKVMAIAVPKVNPPDGGVGVGHYVSSLAGPNIFSGVNINTRVGANAFYDAGFTGTSVIAANIEAGHAWSGHDTLGHVTTFISGPGTPGAGGGGAAAAFDRHATWATHAMGGRTTVGGGEWQRGIAYGATIWSGAIATSWTPPAYSLSFSFATFAAMFTPYQTALITGVAGSTADVVNSSWGFGGDSAGRAIETMGIDGMIFATKKVVVFSAGNSGPTLNTVGGPATGYNTIAVAALGSDTDSPTYHTVSSFSSRGPVNIFIPTAAVGSGTGGPGLLLTNQRARVDIAAPGQNLTLAFYGGTTGGNTGGASTPGANLYSGNIGGTSFAAPTVAGGVALLIDAGRANGLANIADTRVVKTILMTSADKTNLWNNGQFTDTGVQVTSQALDHNVGAGRMNLTRALPFVNSADSTRDVPGIVPGNQGLVESTGWDLGSVSVTSPETDYYINETVTAGSTNITVTLNWLNRRSITGISAASVADNGYTDLDLRVFKIEADLFTTLVGVSNSSYNNTEHLHFTLTAAGSYGIRVTRFGDRWNFDGATSETYGLAWTFTPSPEPAGLLLLGLAALALRRRVC